VTLATERSNSGAKRPGFIGVGDPSAIRHGGRLPTVLAFHGFGGTPLEVELVIDVARELGLAAWAPVLPGHGTHPRDLAKTGWRDWIGGAAACFEEAARSGPVILGGISLGALVAAKLAARYGDRTLGLIMLANAAWLSAPFPAWVLEGVAALRLPDFALPKSVSDIADPETRRSHLSYASQPVHAAIEVLRAGKEIRSEFARIHCPVLLVHGERDRVCPCSNAERVAKLIGTTDKRVVLLPRSRHIITRDLDRAQLGSELRRFLVRLGENAADRKDQPPVEP
jgi:carboxylesterase